MIEVMMDQARADVEGGDGLCTLGLAVCIGVAIVGEYPYDAEAGETRHDKFLAHLADGPMMEVTFGSLKRQVESAKRNGLGRLRVKMSIVSSETLPEDSKFSWSESAVKQTKDTNALYAHKVGELTKSSSGLPLMRVETHHVNEAVDMEILASKEIRILT